MIGRINGTLVSIKPPMVVVEASGIGYEIDLPMSDFAELSEIGTNIILYNSSTANSASLKEVKPVIVRTIITLPGVILSTVTLLVGIFTVEATVFITSVVSALVQRFISLIVNSIHLLDYILAYCNGELSLQYYFYYNR